MKIESTDQDIRTLLASAYYKIPRFQRPYSWDRENIQEFWDDIVRDKPSDYFIGSMVVYKSGNDSYGVVDGQQRLTTITILLCVLRDKLGELGFSDLAEGIHGLVERKNIDNKPEYIITTETAYPFFQDHIQKWGKPELEIAPLREEEGLQRAYDQLKLLVDEVINSIVNDVLVTPEGGKKSLNEKLIGIRDALLNLKLIFVKLNDEDDAYIIFETLNTRGKDLSLTDLVKNHLTKLLKSSNSSVDQAKTKWKKMLETIEGSSTDLEMDTFIHHFWLSKYNYLAAKSLFKVLKKDVTKPLAKNFLDDLLKDASTYRSIHETSYGKWTKQERRIVDSLEALMLFRVRQQTPCVLALVREFNSGKVKKKHLEDALIAIEKFHFFFTAVTSQRSSGGISEMYASLGRRLHEAMDTEEAVSVIQDLKTKLKDRIPSIDEVKVLFPSIIYTENFTKQRKLMKYILVGLDKAQGGPVAIDYEQQTIEHLVPQSEIGRGSYNDLDIGQIGNLILVSEDLNLKLKDKQFKDKKKILIDAGWKIPPDINKSKDWTIKEIQARTQALATEAYKKVWKI